MDLEEYVPNVIWGHYQEFDKFWPCCTCVKLKFKMTFANTCLICLCRVTNFKIIQVKMRWDYSSQYGNCFQLASQCNMNLPNLATHPTYIYLYMQNVLDELISWKYDFFSGKYDFWSVRCNFGGFKVRMSDFGYACSWPMKRVALLNEYLW